MKVKEVAIWLPNGQTETYVVGENGVTSIVASDKFSIVEIYFTDGFMHLCGMPYVALG